MDRSCGILLPFFSLPSPYGIGTLGREARRFVDFLAEAGQSWWQVLPLGPTGFGDSPYQSFSSFAGNPYLIDLELLSEEGLLRRAEIQRPDWGDDPARVDYGLLYRNRAALLKMAANRGYERYAREISAFRQKNRSWLEDYALFMAIKDQFGGRPWQTWPEALRRHDAKALAEFSAVHSGEITFHVFCQFMFFRQYHDLREYAVSKGIGMIGDLPIYAAADSADVWGNQMQFCLNGDGSPAECAGVPPDYFSAEGQLWGNPLYRWDVMAADDYEWWRRRVMAASTLYDAVRIDHFRGFESYWSVPSSAGSAKEGQWRKGPGLPFLKKLEECCPQMQFIAEDLGILSPAVVRLKKDCGWPGMAVLQFAFDAGGESDYLPERIGEKTVCYIGTHDNSTLPEWCGELSTDDLRFAMDYLHLQQRADLPDALLRAGMHCDASIFISRLQDWFPADGDARINTPGTQEGNWRWRMKKDALTETLAARMRTLSCSSHRQKNTKCC